VKVNGAIWFSLLRGGSAGLPGPVPRWGGGRADGPPQELIDRANLVTEMREVKHYYQAGVLAQAGIEH